MITKNYINKDILNKKKIRKFSIDVKKVFNNVIKSIHDPRKTLHVLSNNYRFNFNLNELRKFKRFKSIVIIGMGGSTLGAEAIYNFLGKKIKKKFYFFNDLDIKKILDFEKKVNLNKTLFFIISKSGGTTETLSNTFSIDIIKKNAKNVILISERKNNFLYALSKKNNLFYIEHKNSIGGRFSVLSEVGIVPAFLMGVNIFKLRSKTLKFLKGKSKIFLESSCIKLSDLLCSRKINNLIFINYVPELDKFLFWNQQLIAESLGKKGKGFLPMVSNAPKDHHSLLQLYLDGPKDKIYYIFSCNENSKKKIVIKKNISQIKSYLDKKKISEVKNAQIKALIEVFKIKKIPFREFKINKINEESLSELFSYFILETIIVGKLSKINPYDQPAVETVKILTKKLLLKKTKKNL